LPERVDAPDCRWFTPTDSGTPSATEMLRAGSNLDEVGQVLRHQKLLTTSIYAKVDRTTLSALALPWPGGVA
jgi:hypothetical protein